MIAPIVHAVRTFIGSLRARGEQYFLWPFSGPPRKGVPVVTEETALTLAAYWCGVRLLAEGESRLPLNLLKSKSGGGSELAENHPLYWLLKKRPNPMMTSMQWRETVMLHLLTWGNSYSRIERDGLDRIKALWPIHPSSVTLEESGKSFKYVVTRKDKALTFGPDEILHLRGLSQDGLMGLSPIEVARRSLSITMSAETYGENFFANNASPHFALFHPGKLGKEGRKNLRESWDEVHKGAQNAGKTAVFEEGVEAKNLSLPPEAAQFILTRKFGVVDVARWLNIPPSMLHDLEYSADRANFEQSTLNYLVVSLDPWNVRIEQQFEMSLLSEEEIRAGFHVKHVTAAFQRADFKTRHEAYWFGRQAGIYSADDILELEDRNPLPNGAGKTYLIPSNHKVVDPSKPQGEQILEEKPPANVVPIRPKQDKPQEGEEEVDEAVG